MKRLIVAALAAATLTACVSDREFENRDGVCFRTITEKWFFFVPVDQREVQTVPANCRGE